MAFKIVFDKRHRTPKSFQGTEHPAKTGPGWFRNVFKTIKNYFQIIVDTRHEAPKTFQGTEHPAKAGLGVFRKVLKNKFK